MVLAPQLPPDLAHAIDLEVVIEDSAYLELQGGVTLGSRRSLGRISTPGDMSVIGRRGDWQDFADLRGWSLSAGFPQVASHGSLSSERPSTLHRLDRRQRTQDRPTRAALLWHGKSLWCRHCFASRIAAAEAERASCRRASNVLRRKLLLQKRQPWRASSKWSAILLSPLRRRVAISAGSMLRKRFSQCRFSFSSLPRIRSPVVDGWEATRTLSSLSST